MFKISSDKKITMVQGDTGVIWIRISNYKLSQGDEVRFAIVNKANPSILICQHSDKKIVLEKQVTVFQKDGSARITIEPYDTEYLQPGKYLYEIQVETKDGIIDTVVPLTALTLMDGSIQGEFGETTPTKPEPTPSEIELRFKRLENEIIPELGNRITNVENEIDSVNSSLDNITNELGNRITNVENEIDSVNSSLDNIMNELDEGKSIGAINVTEFGAVGDGITDDTQAIQNALDASYEQNKVLKFEAKHYKITGTLYLNDKLCWEGTNRIKNIWSPIDNCETHFDIYFNSTFKELFKAKSTVSADWGLIPTLPMVRVSIRNIGFINKGDNTLEMRDTILFEGMALHHFTLEDSYTFRIGTVIHGALCLLSTIRNNVFMEIERTFIRSDNFEEAWGSTYRVSINDSYIEHNYFSGSPRFTDIKMFDLFYPGLSWIQNNFIEFCYIAFDINTPAYATNINNNVLDYIFLGFTSTQGGFSANIDNNTFSHCTKDLFRNHYPTEEIIERVNEDKMETENWKALHVPQGSLTNTTFKNNRFAGCDMGISFKDCWSLDNFICKGNTVAPADNQTNFIFTDFMETGIYHYLDTPLNAYIEECDGLTVDDLPSPILVKSGEGSTLYSFDKQILYVNGDKYQNINGVWNKLNSTKIPLNVIGNFYNSWEFGDVTDITRSAYSCSYNAPQASMMVGHYNVHDLYKGKTYKIGYSDAVNCELVVYNSTNPDFPVITGSGQQEATVTFPSDITELSIMVINIDIGQVSIKGVYMNEV